ncbi:MAG: MFS transporter, partial [Venatoribacter sp.]
MNFRIYIMAIAAMAVGLVELLVGGILPVIASDLNVSLSAAGQLITFFALTYAISGPVLYVLTSRFERKLLYLISLFVFCLANVLTYFSESFFWVMVARIVTAAATS